MTTFALSQQWVSKVTMSEEPDLSVVGASPISPPTRDELQALLDELSRSETVREMSRRKWIQPAVTTLKNRVTERSSALFEFLVGQHAVAPAYAMFRGRRLSTKRALLDDFATQAWVGYLTQRSYECPVTTRFRPASIDRHFLLSLAQLSTRADGPVRALEAVRELGICVILESGLPGMSVDGASFHVAGAPPVVALTVRHDRLDNFWFTLFHELGHISLHLSEPSDDIFVDAEEDGGGDEVEVEAEANAFAKDNLIPRDVWLRSDAYRSGSEASVTALASQQHIHPAIVAGRIRYERRDFRIFNDLIGRGQVREVVFGD
jgi:HTH-type transcriptional regulator / antitoxin HigA